MRLPVGQFGGLLQGEELVAVGEQPRGAERLELIGFEDVDCSGAHGVGRGYRHRAAGSATLEGMAARPGSETVPTDVLDVVASDFGFTRRGTVYVAENPAHVVP